MTPFLEDLIADKTKSKALVEVANGNLVKAPLQGTALITIVDVKTLKQHQIYLKDILYVPGLSRRLFSVTQWTQCGGSLAFNGDICSLEYSDPSQGTSFKMQLDAPFSPQADARLIVPTATEAKVTVSSDLLHRRLGHRSIAVLELAHKSNFWQDISMKKDPDSFCWDCEIAFSRKRTEDTLIYWQIKIFNLVLC